MNGNHIAGLTKDVGRLKATRNVIAAFGQAINATQLTLDMMIEEQL